ncbi:DUF3267 domain-containing protein [Gloeocapsopsis sp. IPPAS B-1203]|uniref:DUF3267 domain-containing protein n=1 Tax=Gloeocapsopsis sp. IPPAS B-1203 TaxID=2049454 RepID=UPI000C17D2BA|nr:DUF3267 domain-containing protein [Gloeocapsopsis sp. IPPAS B-1203]PIG90657.1 hypothetical protein CSQ79_25170 [Gloeocapsopsis sp. IPPAS B-1203]
MNPTSFNTQTLHQRGYQLLDELTLTRTLAAKFFFLATGGFFLFLPIFLATYAFLAGTNQNINFGFSQVQGWLGILLLIGLTIIFHELIHGAVMSIYGGKPRYGVGLSHFVLPYAYATSSKVFTRNQFLQITLAPFAIISVLGVLLMVVLQTPWLAIALAINAAGAIVDVWVSSIVWRYPRHILVEDTVIGLRIYGKSGDRRVAHSANGLFWNFFTGFALAMVVIWLGLGFVLPVILSMLGVETLTLGIPDTPLSLYQYQRTDDGGFLSSIQFINVLALSSAVGLIYGINNSKPKTK